MKKQLKKLLNHILTKTPNQLMETCFNLFENRHITLNEYLQWKNKYYQRTAKSRNHPTKKICSNCRTPIPHRNHNKGNLCQSCNGKLQIQKTPTIKKHLLNLHFFTT